jgi:phospholipase C
MSFKRIASNTLHLVRAGLVTMAISQFAIGVPLASANPNQTSNDNKTSSPIKHVIVIIGENRSFDHVFATYVPKHGQSVMNLLSEGIINANGTPGRNFYKAEQRAAVDQAPDEFLLSPDKTSFPNHVLPAPLVGGPQTSYITSGKLSDAIASENGLLTSDSSLLLSGGTGLTSKTPDTRISDVSALPTGPFQLTNKSTFSYDDYAASPVHRFYQMWQPVATRRCSPGSKRLQAPAGPPN